MSTIEVTTQDDLNLLNEIHRRAEGVLELQTFERLPDNSAVPVSSVTTVSVESVTDDSGITTQQDPENSNAFFFTTLTPASDLVFVPLSQTQYISGRAGNDTFYGFDQSLNSTQTPINIEIFVGDSEIAPIIVITDVLNTIGGNPPSGGQDRFVLGDWRTSFYTNNGYNDFAFLLDFNRNEDVIQLNGFAEDYDFVNIPFLGTAIFQRDLGSQSVFDGDLVGIVFFAFDLDPDGTSLRYVGNTPPAGPVEPQIKQLGTAGLEVASDTAVDPWGDIYVIGATSASLGGTNIGSFDSWIAKYNTNGEQLFILQFGSIDYDIIQAISTDNFGNFYVVGATQGDLAVTKQSVGQDAVIAKYDSDGNQLWIQQFGFEEALVTLATNVTVDDNSNVYVSGVRVIGDDRPLAAVIAQGDVFVSKYDTNGNQQWFTTIATPIENFPLGPEGIWEEAYAISLGPDGSVYTTGWTVGGLETPNADPTTATNDTWITKLTNDGQIEWTRQFGSTEFDYAWSIDTDSQGNVYSYGWTQGNLAGEIAGFSDLILAKYSPDGTQQWVKQFGTSGDDAAFIGGVRIDANDNIYLAGFTDGNFGGSNAGSYDAFVALFDTSGNQIWTQQFGTGELDYATNIDFDNLGNLYVTGFTEGSLGAINAGSVDAWVAKLDASSGSLLNFNPQAYPSPDEIVGTSVI